MSHGVHAVQHGVEHQIEHEEHGHGGRGKPVVESKNKKIALLISVIGVAGVLAFSVSSRTREFGIRIAMGAQPRNILTNVLTEGVVMAAATRFMMSVSPRAESSARTTSASAAAACTAMSIPP